MSEPGYQEIHSQADGALKAGDANAASRLYEQSYDLPRAIRSAEQAGDFRRAYNLAVKSGVHYAADRLAATHNIAGHEYSSFAPPISPEADMNKRMRVALESRLKEGATATRLGFHGFAGKRVVDVGTRDGRFVPLFRGLGAIDVYGVDPEASELDKAVEAGILDRERTIPTTVEDMPPGLKGTFDVATIFNFNIPLPERERDL